jgi:hypothetical protein
MRRLAISPFGDTPLQNCVFGLQQLVTKCDLSRCNLALYKRLESGGKEITAATAKFRTG